MKKLDMFTELISYILLFLVITYILFGISNLIFREDNKFVDKPIILEENTNGNLSAEISLVHPSHLVCEEENCIVLNYKIKNTGDTEINRIVLNYKMFDQQENLLQSQYVDKEIHIAPGGSGELLIADHSQIEHFLIKSYILEVK